MALSKRHKKQLIGGLIGVFLLALTLIVKSYFAKPTLPNNPKSVDTTKAIVQSPTITSKDSSQQTVNQLNQVNKNKGNVTNEFVSRDKIENQKNYYNNPEPKAPAKRHVTKNDIKVVEAKIPKDYTISLWYCFSDNECAQYGQELVNKLIADGYTVQTNAYGSMPGGNYNYRFDMTVKDDSKTAELTVYVLREK